MAHFAQLDQDNKVINIVVINNDVIKDPSTGIENENDGIIFCKSLYGQDTTWIQASYNGNFRKQYPAKGFIYDVVTDRFLAPKPYNSWTFNDVTGDWEPPIPKPTDGLMPYFWNETEQTWKPLSQNITTK